jgi:hypothetical protein
LHRQMVQERLDRAFVQVLRQPALVKPDQPDRPVQIRLLRPVGPDTPGG